MNLPLEVLVGPLASAVVVGLVSWGAVKSSVVKLETRMEERAAALVKREEQVDAKFERLERVLGISDGLSSVFMRRTECSILDQGISSKLTEIKTELHAMRLEVDGRLGNLELRVSAIEKVIP